MFSRGFISEKRVLYFDFSSAQLINIVPISRMPPHISKRFLPGTMATVGIVTMIKMGYASSGKNIPLIIGASKNAMATHLSFKIPALTKFTII